MAAYSPAIRSAALVLTAKSFLAEARWNRAVEAAKRALAADACNRDAVWAMIVAMRNSGESDRAVKLVEGAIGRLPLCHAFRYEAWKLGVEKDFTAVIKNHAPAETLMELGALYASAGLSGDAREIYLRAKGNILAAIRAAYLSRDEKALEAASGLSTDFVHPYCREDIPVLRWASEKGRSWKFDYLYSLLLASVGRDAEADSLLAGCAGRPDRAAFYLFRASRTNGAAALADIDRAERIADGWRTALARHHAYAGGDDWKNALLSLKAVLDKYPGNPGIQINYARALVKNGEYAEAVKFLESIRFLPSEVGENPRPIYQEALVALAEAALERGDETAAREYVRKALLFPETLGSGRSFNWKRIAESWPENVRRLADDIR
jgi:tetratricopeptide (TPR) repeat protein